MKREDAQGLIECTYFEWLTSYFLVSKSYPILLENDFLGITEDGLYIDCLMIQVQELINNNIYPASMLTELTNLVECIKDHLKRYPDLANASFTIDKIDQIMHQTTFKPSNDIYYFEYLERYADVSDLWQMKAIPISRLEKDIENDYVYLDILLAQDELYLKNKFILEQAPDLENFYNKLMVELPWLFQLSESRKRLLNIIKHSPCEKKEEILKKMRHFSKKKLESDTHCPFYEVEKAGCNLYLLRVMKAPDVHQALEEIPDHLYLYEPFLTAFQLLVEEMIEMPDVITSQFVFNFQYLIMKIRDKMFADKVNNHKEINDNLAYIIRILNSIKPLPLKQSSQFLGNGFALKVYLYITGNTDECKVSTDAIINTLDLLIEICPLLFMDSSVRTRSLQLLDSPQTLTSFKIKEKLKRYAR